jgi:putative oxidoreductase
LRIKRLDCPADVVTGKGPHVGQSARDRSAAPSAYWNLLEEASAPCKITHFRGAVQPVESEVSMLGAFSGTFYAFLRIVSGFLFACHGAQKLFGWLGEDNVPAVLTLRWFAGIIEFFGGTLIAVGLLTGPVAFLASGQMAVAYFLRHAGDNFWPILNGGELAALYCFLFLYISTRGSGSLSVDAMMGRKG